MSRAATPALDSELPADVQEKLKALEAEDAVLLASLPDYMQKLLDGYKRADSWFEVFECVRKLAIVCFPVLLPSGDKQESNCKPHTPKALSHLSFFQLEHVQLLLVRLSRAVDLWLNGLLCQFWLLHALFALQ